MSSKFHSPNTQTRTPREEDPPAWPVSRGVPPRWECRAEHRPSISTGPTSVRVPHDVGNFFSDPISLAANTTGGESVWCRIKLSESPHDHVHGRQRNN
jgi:hypothetical protein